MDHNKLKKTTFELTDKLPYWLAKIVLHELIQNYKDKKSLPILDLIKNIETKKLNLYELIFTIYTCNDKSPYRKLLDNVNIIVRNLNLRGIDYLENSNELVERLNSKLYDLYYKIILNNPNYIEVSDYRQAQQYLVSESIFLQRHPVENHLKYAIRRKAISLKKKLYGS